MSYDKDSESENNLSDYESEDQTLENSEEKEYFQKELESEDVEDSNNECENDETEETIESSSSIKESFECVTNRLNNFLNECRILPNNPNNLPSTDANVLRVSYPPGKYYISHENYDSFIDYYIDVLTHEEFNYQKYQLNFGERDCDTKPLLLDFDFNYTANIENRIYDNVIIDIINIVDNVIVTNFDIEHPISYLFEKNKPTKKDEKTFKDGVHIVYSYPFSPNQRDYIYSQVLEKLKENQTFDNLNVTNSYNDIFDYTTINTNCWMMYGSTKILKKNDKIEICPKYQLTKAFKDGVVKSLKVNNIAKYVKFFSIRKFEIDSPVDVMEGKEFINEFTYKKEKEKKEKKKEYQDDINDVKSENQQVFDYSVKETSDINTAKFYLSLIKASRANEYDSWMRIGWALKSVHSSLFDDFINFSKLSSKFDLKSCEDIWNRGKCGVGMCNINTLKQYALIDNKEEYLKHLISNNEYFNNALSGTNSDIANYLIQKLPNYIVTGTKKDRTWYTFEGHMWIKDESLVDVIKIINSSAQEFTNEYNRLISPEAQKLNDDRKLIIDDINLEINPETSDYKKSMNDAFNNVEKGFEKAQKKLIELKNEEKMRMLKLKDKFKKYIFVANKLKNVSDYTDGIIKACGNLLHDDNIFGKKKSLMDIMDSNLELIGFENGIYNTKTNEFRDGQPSDYVSKSTGYKYKEFTNDHPMVKKVYEYFASFQPNPNKCKFLIQIIANCLRGENNNQKFYIFYGGGRNGKSVLCEKLLANVFGDYYGTVEPTMVTKSKTSNSLASPEILEMKGKRIIILSEPEQSEKLQTGIMKRLTGGDTLKGRGILSNQIINFKAQFTPFYLCNIKPEIDTTDYGTWRRISEVGFDIQFIPKSSIPKSGLKENQRIMDPKVNDYVCDGEFIQATMWILLQTLKEINENGGVIIEPEEVINATVEFQSESNNYEGFLNLHYKEDVDGYVELQEMFRKFKMYIKDLQAKFNPTIAELRGYLKNSRNFKVAKNQKVIINGVETLIRKELVFGISEIKEESKINKESEIDEE